MLDFLGTLTKYKKQDKKKFYGSKHDRSDLSLLQRFGRIYALLGDTACVSEIRDFVFIFIMLSRCLRIP